MSADCDGGITALHFIAGSDSVHAYSTAAVLLERGADPNARSEDGVTPVHVAAEWGRYESLRLLLVNGGDPLSTTTEGLTAVDLASEQEHGECVELLNNWICSANDDDGGGDDDDDGDSWRTAISTSNADHDQCRVTLVQESYSKAPAPDRVDLPASNNTTTTSGAGHRHHKLIARVFRRINNFSNCCKRHDGSPSPRKGAAEDSTNNNNNSINNNTTNNNNKIRNRSNKPGSKPAFDLDAGEIGSAGINRVLAGQRPKRPPRPVAAYSKQPKQKQRVTLDHGDDSELDSLCKELTTGLNIVTDDDSFGGSTSRSGQPQHNDQPRQEEVDAALLGRTLKMDDLTLRRELTNRGLDVGPITAQTKGLYAYRLAVLLQEDTTSPFKGRFTVTYSVELKRALCGGDIDFSSAADDELELTQYFDSTAKAGRPWREGVLKMSFCYLLLDPHKLDQAFDVATGAKKFQVFVESIFYIGKGKQGRPYQHLIEAATKLQDKATAQVSAKTRRILEIWRGKSGVVSLHVFPNLIPVDAFTREAAMIDAIGKTFSGAMHGRAKSQAPSNYVTRLINLCNVKRGDYYGLASRWSAGKRRRLGCYLLHKCMEMLDLQGRRQLFPRDVINVS